MRPLANTARGDGKDVILSAFLVILSVFLLCHSERSEESLQFSFSGGMLWGVFSPPST